MAHFIIHHNGAYNIYSTIVDAPILSSAVDLDTLTKLMLQFYGEEGVRELQNRLLRTHEKGTSSLIDSSLEECISRNRAGENEAELDIAEFIAKYLTIGAGGLNA